jgi:hypothetical protein
MQERDGWDDVKLIAGLMSPVVPRNSVCERNSSGVISYSMNPPVCTANSSYTLAHLEF